MHLSLGNESATEKLKWTITNFNRIPPRAGIPFKSSIIHKRHARKVWRFFLYPSSNSDQNYVAAFFAKAYRLFDPMLYNCSMSIGGLDRNPTKSFEFSSTDFSLSSIGGDKCFRRDSVEKLRKGSVTVQCEITEVSQKSFFPSAVDDYENLSLDLTVLYNDPIFTDLTVHIQEYQFYLHTCVLYARARRLSHLFGYQSFNQMPKSVELNNISPNLFQQLMIYLYSGKFESPYLELFMYADKLKLQSFKQTVYEKVQEHRTHTEIATQTLTITWDLKEIQFRENGAVPFVQIFHAECCMTHLAVRVGISDDYDGEKYVDVSFKVFMDTAHRPVSLLCVMTLFSYGRVRVYEKDNYNIEPDEEWHFPPFVKLNEIPGDCGSYMYLTAEISLSDGCSAYNNLHTKTRLFSQSKTATCPERLGSDIGRLLSPKVESRFKKHDLYLKSADNCSIPVYKAIVFARWPAIRGYCRDPDVADSSLMLNLSIKEIEMLLNYIYTGSLPSLDYSTAKKLLQANAKMDFPPYIVQKCQDLLYGRNR